MFHRGREVCGLLTALAVLLVSVACSSAGCMLPLGQSRAKDAIHSCCAERNPGHGEMPQVPPHRDPCPLCHTAVAMGQTLEKSTLTASHPALFPLIVALGFSQDLPPALPARASDSRALSFPIRPPTLLALHCALLN